MSLDSRTNIAVRWYDHLDSTNEEAKRLASQGEKGPLWLAAKRQSFGRGRRGRKWISEIGNIYATKLLHLDCYKRAVANLSFVTSLAVYDVCANALHDIGSTLTHEFDAEKP